MDDSTVWKLIETYFQENPQALVKHHIDSYNDFYTTDIFQLLREMNPIKIDVDYDKSIEEFRSKCRMFVGGKDGTQIYFGKPIIHDSTGSHYMYPNEARLRNMSYSITIHYDVEIEYTRILRENDEHTPIDDNGYAIYDELKKVSVEGEGGGNEKKTGPLKKDHTPSEMAELRENTKNTLNKNTQFIKIRLQKLYLGKFPIMVQSKLCILNGMPREMRFVMGECKNDIGGYFIIDGKEKVIVPQESFGDNILNIYPDKDEKYLFAADIRSVSENVSKPIRQLSLRILASTPTKPRHSIGVFIPNAGNKPIPLFIVFRALGVLSDKEIMTFCTLQDRPPTVFEPYFEACVHEAAQILTQYDAVKFISMLVKARSVSRTMRILADYFLPHVGEVNFLEKAYHLGYMTQRLLAVATGIDPPTDRDSYKCKRLTLIGPLMKDLFREYYEIQKKHIEKFFEYRYEFGKDTYYDLSDMIYRKYEEAFSERIVEAGVRKAFKGNWGAYSHTKKVGIVQDMNRLSHNGMISHLRKTNLPMDASVKLVGPRVLHGSQWGVVDPIDTPDGGNVGLHKHLSMATHVTSAMSREPLIQWLTENTSLKRLTNASPSRLGRMSKVLVNGFWVGCVSDPITVSLRFRMHRRHGLVPLTTSVMFDHARNTLSFCCDGGRLCRPILYKDENGEFGFQRKEWDKLRNILTGKSESIVSIWEKLISGFHERKSGVVFNPYHDQYYKWNDLYDIPKENNVTQSKALLEFLDTQETEGSYIAMHYDDVAENSRYTHCEIHPSTAYGVMCNLINFLEHNPASRNSFSCGQSKQACSLYSTNYQLRMDKTAVVLNSGQIPLVKSRYMQYINNEENPYGENAIVAIMCYTGYNVEDAVLINEGALQRGLFRTTYYTTYEAHEEREIKNDIVMRDKTFGDVSRLPYIEGMKPDYDYSHLNEHGLIPEETPVDDKTVLIGQSTLADVNTGKRVDCSKTPKKGQLGIVDKSFLTEDEEGKRIAKIRIREQRIPAMGDKFASRAGQKGTIGMIIPEENMPFTKNGVRPDMIINPHALPSRMTIGQMIECIVGKAACMDGVAGECTAFYNRENKLGVYGELLTKHKFHSTGDEILYDGMSGKQLEASIFIGPTYYMRLKHMVKDKINHRATGPLTKLTRQPVHGRANDGGLRIGEMERDAVISHGMAGFLQESMMHRADAYRMAVCNKTGMIAIYNENKDLMISPGADGPLQYSGSLEKEGEIEIKQITKHGRSFSLVEVPYSLKLLMQEMQGLNVHMRLITDDNINQLETMNFSHNIDLCLKTPNATPQMVIDQIDVRLKESRSEVNQKIDTPEDSVGPLPEDSIPSIESTWTEHSNQTEMMNAKTPPYIEANSPAYPDSDSPVFDPRLSVQPDGTVMWNPNVNANANAVSSDSPQFVLNSPSDSYIPHNSPAFNPNDFATPENSQSPQRPNDYLFSPTDGGSMRGGAEYIEGDKVFYKGDIKPNRLWTIHNINKDSITIDTDDIDLITVSDTRKVVQPKDIRRPELFDITPLEKTLPDIPMELQTIPFTPMVQGPIPSMLKPPEEKPSVNIKIFNQGGVDNSQDNNPSTEGDIIGNVPNTPIDFSVPMIAPPPANASISDNAPIDYNNLVIQKTE